MQGRKAPRTIAPDILCTSITDSDLINMHKNGCSKTYGYQTSHPLATQTAQTAAILSKVVFDRREEGQATPRPGVPSPWLQLHEKGAWPSDRGLWGVLALVAITHG